MVLDYFSSQKTTALFPKQLAAIALTLLLSCPHTAYTQDLAPTQGNTKPNDQTQDSIQIRGGVSVGVQGEEIISSLSLRDTDVSDVLYMLAEQAGFNIIVDKAVSGSLSLDLKDISINKTLEYIFTLTDLTYRKDGNTLIVTTTSEAETKGLNKLMLKSLPVKYSNAEELTEVLNDTVFSLNRPGGNSNALATSDKRTNSILIMGNEQDIELAQRALKELDFPLTHKTFFLKYANPELVANNIAQILFPVGIGETTTAAAGGASSAQGGDKLVGVKVVKGGPMTFIANPDNNTLTMIGSAEQVEMAEGLLYDLDIRPAQVVMQVAVLELSHNRSKGMTAGVNPLTSRESGQILTSDDSLNHAKAEIVRTVDAAGNITTTIRDRTANPTPDRIDGTGLLRGSKTAFQYGVGSNLLLWDRNLGIASSGFLQSLRVNGSLALTTGKILSNPTVMALSGQTSTMSVTRQVFAGNRTTVDQVTGIATTTPILSNVGITLNIQPTVLSDGTVSMLLQPTVSSPSGQAPDGTGGTITLTSSTTLNVQSARIKDGQTLILAGLIREAQNSGWDKTPFLSDIPIIGALFRATSANSNERSELVILVTPHIMREDGVAYFRKQWREGLSYDEFPGKQPDFPDPMNQIAPEKIIPASNTLNRSDSGIKSLENRPEKLPSSIAPENDIQKRQSRLQLPTYSEVLK